MQRRTLDILFSIGGLLLAGLLAVLGVVLTSNANFANNYVHDQLSEQKITFTPEEGLSPEEAKADCIVANAGQPLTSGKQAECYANEYIALHLSEVAEGQTYAELGSVQFGLQDQVAAAEESDDPQLADLQAQLDEVNGQRDTLFRGETLRGLLLTSYGFSQFGEKAEQAATVCYIVAALLFLLSIAGFVHAFRTPKSEPFAPAESVDLTEQTPANTESANTEPANTEPVASV
jgi:hypothetical protein